jgi:hypothetical protein
MRIATAIRSLVLAAAVSIIPAASYAGVFVSIGIGAPPVLPVYAQPICPAAGYIWTPGYWAYDEQAGYYWVPGAWVLAPYTGALWTPGYWGWGNSGYLWHAGYWGPHVGFYGGVNYGFGYFGRGYEGGYWNHGVFAYNRSVTNINVVNVHNVYNKTVINNYNTTRVSFNGGHGGVQMRPTGDEQRWAREQHTAPLAAQHQNEMRASQNRAQFANVNHGRPENLARTEPASYNRNMAMNTRPAVNTRPTPNNQNLNRAPESNNNAYHPQANTQVNQHTQPQAYRPQAQPQPQTYRSPASTQMNQHTQPQAYHAQAQPYHPQASPQMNQHAQPQQMHQAPQPQESHGGGGGGHEGGGHDGGGHGHGR